MESLVVEIRYIKMHVKRYNVGAKEKVVFLHGFTGSSSTWDEIVSLLPSTIEVLTVDLLGHGKTSKPTDPARYFVEEQIADLHALLSNLSWSRFTMVGYSMGGRLALAYAIKHPVNKLILESSSPGLVTPEDRLQRKRSDELLADRILNGGVHAFVDFWEDIPLFQSQKSLPLEKQQAIRTERLTQSKVGLANSLKGFSTGVQPANWAKLDQLTCPTLLVTGELDTKFCDIANKMQKLLKNTEWKVVKGVGHAIHVENPELFATMIKDIILEEDNE